VGLAVSLSAAQRAAMDAAVAEVRRLFARARAATAAVASSNQLVDLLGAVGLGVPGVPGRSGDYAAEAHRKQVADQGARAEAWATAERARVEAGAASLAWWMTAGGLYARYAAGVAQDAWNSSVFTTAAGAAAATAKQASSAVRTVVTPSLWPAWVPWALGGVGVVVVLAVAAPYLRTAGVLK
jgi:hypothetical protein